MAAWARSGAGCATSLRRMHPPACRITLQGPARRLDLVLPSSLPVLELLPRLVELGAGTEQGAGGPLPWRLSRPVGPDLELSRTLRESDVRDGELLLLRHEHAPVLGVLRSDPVVALAATVDGMPGDWSPRRRAGTALAVLGPSLVVLLAVLTAATTNLVAGLGAVAVAGLLLAAAASSDRPQRRTGPAAGAAGDLDVSGVLAQLTAVPVAFAGLQLALHAGWGAAATVCVTAGGALLGVLLAAVVPAARDVSAGLAAGLGLLCLSAGVAATRIGPARTAAVALVLVLALLPAMTGLTLRLVGVVRMEGSASAPVAAGRAGTARRTLVAATAGLGVLCVLFAGVVAANGGASGRWLAGLGGLALLLRSRTALRSGEVLAQALPGLAAVAVALVAAGVQAWSAGHRLLAVLAAAVLPVGMLIGAHPLARPAFGSPPADRFARRLEGMTLLALIPVGLAVLGTYGAVADAANRLT